MTTNSNNQAKASQAAAASRPSKPPAKKAANAGYQEQPNAQKELEQAIMSVPLKNYSDYEITIEAKQHYDDALFASDDDLNEALQQKSVSADSTTPAQATQHKADKSRPIEYDEPSTQEDTVIDFSVFLTDNCKTTIQDSPQPDSQQAAPLSVIDTGLNDSPVSPTIDFEDDGRVKEPLMVEAVESATAKQPAETTAPKTLAEKLKQKAKAQLNKSKADFDEYTGRSLPERELPLEFSFAPLKPKKEFDSIVSGYEIRKLFDIKGKSNHSIFKQADTDLAKLVKCQFSSSSRQQLLDAYSEPLFAKTQEVITLFERKPSVPGDAKRLELAELALSTLKHLITGYKQIYLSLYESANVLYGPQRSNANKIAFRLIDLLVLEQLLATAVQAPLPSNSIKTFNKMFCALSAYEPQLITLPQPSLSLGDRSSIKALYLRYQAILVLDLMRISASLHKAVKPYIDRYIGLLTVLPFDRSIAPSADAWVISHDSNTVPGFLALGEKINHGRFPSVVIEVGRFFNAIKKDYAECIELLTGSNKKHSSKVLGAIKLPYAATIISELNHSILFNENNQHIPSFSSYQPFPCKVYSGFDDCIAYFNYQYALKTKKPERKGESVKDLPPKPTAAKGEWLCAMRDENSLYLQVNEGKISLPIDIGHVLLFAVENANDESEQTQTLLTQVIRMERGQHGKLSVIVKLIGSQITHVSTATAAKDPAANHSSALLAINGEQRIFIADHQYPIGASVAIALPDSSPAMIALEGFTVITQKIQCLLLR